VTPFQIAFESLGYTLSACLKCLNSPRFVKILLPFHKEIPTEERPPQSDGASLVAFGRSLSPRYIARFFGLPLAFHSSPQGVPTLRMAPFPFFASRNPLLDVIIPIAFDLPVGNS